jgi:tetratricopeptide (TPR) repeat protein
MIASRSESHTVRPALERVRRAERLIAEGKYENALEELRAAQAEEPTNQYIPALVERTVALLYPSTVRRDAPDAASLESTVSEAEEDGRVRRLTLVAQDLFNRGSYEMAFQTLLKAFQIAPTSPHVLECQKALAPAMELMRRRGTVTGIHLPARRATSDADEQAAADWRRRIITAPQKQREPQLDPQQARIEALRRKKELERREREIAIWREASRPPRLMPKGPGSAPEEPDNSPSCEPS